MVQIRKHSGEVEEFDLEKVKYALIRSGASEQAAQEISGQVSESIYDGITTSKVYHIAYNLLQKQDTHSATRFGLKAAIMRLGPTGFPFEKYMARILDEHGYVTKTNNILEGACITHEVDIIAEKKGVRYMIECKYHNQPGFSSGLKEALYTWARFEDLTAGGQSFQKPWIITNTKITSEAIKYSLCKGMLTTSWGYPEHQTLQDMIEGECMYPITILRNVSNEMKEALCHRNIMLVKDLINMGADEISKITHVKQKKLGPLMQEIHGLQENPRCST
ncbi:MAG: restriction endonuclease [Candidatus Altiarchaeota archaeon]|nr:restriction endonuclease [Candidatus Altiarchaeota archaeon]